MGVWRSECRKRSRQDKNIRSVSLSSPALLFITVADRLERACLLPQVLIVPTRDHEISP